MKIAEIFAWVLRNNDETEKLENEDGPKKLFLSLLNIIHSVLIANAENRKQCKLWLVDSISRLYKYSSDDLLKPFLRNREYSNSLLLFLCQSDPAGICQILQPRSSIFRRLFSSNPYTIMSWFGHFKANGRHQFGARAIERFAFANRDKLWSRIYSWEGKEVSPITAAARPHLYMRVNVVETVKNLIEIDEFWESEEFKESIKEGQIISVSPEYFAQEIFYILTEERPDEFDTKDANEIWKLLKLNLQIEEQQKKLPDIMKRLGCLMIDQEIIQLILDHKSNSNSKEKNLYNLTDFQNFIYDSKLLSQLFGEFYDEKKEYSLIHLKSQRTDIQDLFTGATNMLLLIHGALCYHSHVVKVLKDSEQVDEWKSALTRFEEQNIRNAWKHLSSEYKKQKLTWYKYVGITAVVMQYDLDEFAKFSYGGHHFTEEDVMAANYKGNRLVKSNVKQWNQLMEDLSIHYKSLSDEVKKKKKKNKKNRNKKKRERSKKDQKEYTSSEEEEGHRSKQRRKQGKRQEKDRYEEEILPLINDTWKIDHVTYTESSLPIIIVDNYIIFAMKQYSKFHEP